MKLPLSIVISAYNEEAKIAQTLDSVKDIAEEIIVVDNSSTDNTAKIAKKYTKKVFTQKNNPLDIDRQKNFGFSKATKEWTLSLDADEQVTPELADEIRQVLLHTSSTVEGYWIPRRNIIFGKWIEHSGWYPDHQLRLFKTGQGKYVKEQYHQPIEVPGEKAYLHADIIHHNYETIHQFISRNLLVYAKNESEFFFKDGYAFSLLDVIRFPVKEFCSRFFAREGYKDGLHGLVLSFLMGIYHFVIALYLWEAMKFPEQNISISELEKESKNIEKEVRYWMTTSEINVEKNPLKKNFLRAKRKLA